MLYICLTKSLIAWLIYFIMSYCTIVKLEGVKVAPSLLSHKYLKIRSCKDVRPAFVLRDLLKQLMLHPVVVVAFWFVLKTEISQRELLHTMYTENDCSEPFSNIVCWQLCKDHSWKVVSSDVRLRAQHVVRTLTLSLWVICDADRTEVPRSVFFALS